MPTIVQTIRGKVVSLSGTANILGADGKMHPLAVGDVVQRGDVVLTSADGIVTLEDNDAVAVAKQPTEADADIDKVIADLNAENPKNAAAAGLTGGDGAGGLGEGLRVSRISEGVSPLS